MSEQDLCFVIMPFSSPSGSIYPVGHFTEVYEDLFVPAIQASGLRPLRADTTEISRHIVSDLLSTIEAASSKSRGTKYSLSWRKSAETWGGRHRCLALVRTVCTA
jgi:hypothetical protein